MNISAVNNFINEITTKEGKAVIVLDRDKISSENNFNFKDIITNIKSQLNINEKPLSDINQLVNILKENNIINVSEKSVENVNKLMDIVLPLVKDSYGNSVEKTDIMKALKNKLEFANSNYGDSPEVERLNITNIRPNKVLDKTSYSVEIGIINNFIMGVPTKGAIAKDETKILDGYNLNFKDVIGNKNLQLNINEKLLSDVEQLVNILKENNLEKISSESVENINKLIDIVLPLIKDSYGDSIEKTDIIKALKNKLEFVDSNYGDSSDVDRLNITNIKPNKVVDKISHSMEIGIISDFIMEVPIKVGVVKDTAKTADKNNFKDVIGNKNSQLNINEKPLSHVDQLVNILKESNLEKISAESVENINKLIEIILPLVKNFYGENIEKDDIVKAIKDKLKVQDIEHIDEDSLETNSLNIKNVKSNKASDRILYSTEIGIVNDFIRKVTTKETTIKGNNQILDVNNVNFKDVIKNKNQNISKDLTEDNKIIGELETKVGKIEQSIEAHKEDDVREDVVAILNLLNINIVNNESLPIIIELPDRSPITDELVASIQAEPKVVAYNFLGNGQMLHEKPLNYIDQLVNILKENNITNVSEESVENINKLIDRVLPLVKDSYGDNIQKDDIIKVLKSKLEVVNINNNAGDSLEVKSLDIANLKPNKVIDKIPYNLGRNDFKEDESSKFSTIISQGVPVKQLSEEEKVLNKVLGLEMTDVFLQGINKLNIRNDIQASSVVSSDTATVFKDTMDEDIIKNIRFMIKNEIQELKVKIYPKELGEMTIKILSEEGIIRAEIKATSKETYNLLNSNINEIKKLLSNENIKIQEVNIGLYSEDTTYYSGQGSQEGFHNRDERFIANDNELYINANEEVVEEVVNNTNSNVDLLV